jgi:CheY-like chemotaxis protein
MKQHPTTPAAKRILLVEDERDVLDMLLEILAAEGFAAQTASDGEEALARFRRQSYDIVFTDMNMPGLTGLEVAAEIKKLRPEVPVVLLTGWDMEITPAQLRDRGIDALIKKPFAISDILQAIAQLCT